MKHRRAKLTLYGIVQQWIAEYRRDGFVLNKSRIRRIRRLASIAWGNKPAPLVLNHATT